jgi:uncharacterized membrane protein
MSDWYYAANNEQKGPVNESELKADIAANKIPADTLVWKDGMDNWTPANQLPAFSFRPAPAPAAVQPGAPIAATKVVVASPDVNNPDSTKPVGMDDLKGMMGKPEALEVGAEDADQNKIFGILAYVPIPLPLFWLIPFIAAKESPFARYHANQGLVLCVGWLAIAIFNFAVSLVLGMLPSFLSFLSAALGLLYLAPLALAIYGIVNAAAGKCVPLPVIGGIKLLPPPPKAE